MTHKSCPPCRVDGVVEGSNERKEKEKEKMRRHWGMLGMMEGGERRQTLGTQAGRRRRRLSSEAAGTLTENPRDASWSREGLMGAGGKELGWDLGMF